MCHTEDCSCMRVHRTLDLLHVTLWHLCQLCTCAKISAHLCASAAVSSPCLLSGPCHCVMSVCHTIVSYHCVIPLCVIPHCVIPLCHTIVSYHCVIPLCHVSVSQVILPCDSAMPICSLLYQHAIPACHAPCVHLLALMHQG